MNSIRVLERGITISSSDLEKSDAELSAIMLAGYAFENAFKAHYVNSGRLLFVNGKQTLFRDHAFITWVTGESIVLSDWERESLDKAEFFCVGWARYPAHSRLEKERSFETWGWSDVEQVLAVTRRLLPN
ncbi:MAG: hypothetical protein Q8J74_04025 [Candidatus Didemnitutus sp.]|nr:hypothetical protein [Candidatus Didemnitutus sp.]